jgi:hypothetical protein
MNPNPAEMTLEDRAAQFTYWHNGFNRLGIVPMFEEETGAIVWFPVATASGKAEVAACEKLGSELLAYAARRRASLVGLAPAPPVGAPRAGAPVPAADRAPEAAQLELPPLTGDAARMAALEEELARMRQTLAGESQPYQFTTPTPGERRPDPVVR